jgi:uncharacterized protein YecE (DUF72 family)
MSLYLGTSGWAYPEWKPGFYPADLRRDDFLDYYSRALTGCEINATFYRLQSESTVARWADAVPDGFRFAVKAHRGLTHGRELAPELGPDGLLGRFIASLEPLASRLGVVLLQLPPSRVRDDAALDQLLDALPAGLPFAMEFRHASWDAPKVTARVTERRGTVCWAETRGEVPDQLPPGPVAYVRLRATHYSETAREGWVDLLRREAAERPVYVFSKHEGVPAGDPHAGVGLAQWLHSRMAAA